MVDHPANFAALNRALGATGSDEGVFVVRKLVGGTHANTWLVAGEVLGGEAVLREFPAGDTSVAREAQVLLTLDGLDGMAPRLIASGVDDPTPWLMQTRLMGAADITSGTPEVVARELGVALARVHRATDSRKIGLGEVFEMDGGRQEDLTGPAGLAVRRSWERIIAEPLVLTHHDFWSGNVVWDQSHRLSGIVDWNGGSLGPRGFDVGWCRLDLYLLYDERIADLFLQSYEEAFGEVLPDSVLWDLWSVARSQDSVETWVPNYLDLGRADLTAEALRHRHRTWTDSLLQR
jgi:aminoglycoside phosphotransferase (APT) family kinase protein